MIEHTTQTGPETPQQEDPAYVAAMIAKVEGTTTEPQTTQETTEEKLYAGKYKSVDELEKGYAELQKAFSKRAEPNPQTQEEAKNTPEESLKISEEAAEETLEQRGLDIATFSKEFEETGVLSEDSYASLDKAGIPKDMVDAYIEGLQLKAQQLTTRVFDTAGGEEDYRKMVEWAKAGLSKEEQKVYNDTFESGDINKMVMAVKGLKASYEAEYGKQPRLLSGEASNSSAVGFSSKAEMIAAMSDQRYSKDPAYRKAVEAKISHSNLF